MKKTLIEFRDQNTKVESKRLLYGDVSVIIGKTELRYIEHSKDQKTTVINITDKLVTVRNWGD